ncbi:MAG: radical SAM protein [Thermoleophilia bacterium]|nr:radical SAM protein [Thermoleophilia bacterium]
MSSPKVLLITPPQDLGVGEVKRPWISTQPLGLAYVAAAVRDAGFEVRVIDAYSQGLSGATIRRDIKEYQPQIVGISALTPQWADAVQVAVIAKSVSGEILTVIGGPHVTAMPEKAAAAPGVDVAVVGEGEGAMAEICRAVESGSGFGDIEGIAYSLDGKVNRTPPRSFINDLDSLSFPAHDLLWEPKLYNPYPMWGKRGNFSCIISGRGCPYNCSFCDVTSQQGKRYRLRSAGNIVDEFVWLNRDFGVSMFSFRDPSMVCNRRRLLEICDLILANGLDIVWTCSARANEVDPEMLAAMKRAGCRVIQYGIEVGNAEMLMEIKNITREKVAEAVLATRRAGIHAHGYFLFGFMKETEQTIEDTIEFARSLALDSAGFAVMVPFPGTQEYDDFKREGLLLTEDWQDYNVSGKPVYRHRNLTDEQLRAAPRRAYRRFYMRPGIILRHLRMITSLRVLVNYVKSARLMFR